jgi:hypothetical protein
LDLLRRGPLRLTDLERQTGCDLTHLLDYSDAVQPAKEDSEMWSHRDKPLLQWARVATAHGEYEVAVTLLAAIEAFRSEVTLYTREPRYLDEVERTLDAARNQLDAERFHSAWNRGLQMTSAEALDYAVTTLADPARRQHEAAQHITDHPV